MLYTYGVPVFYSGLFSFAYNNTAIVQCIIKRDFSQKPDDHTSIIVLSLSVFVHTLDKIIIGTVVLLLYRRVGYTFAKNVAREQNNNI